MDIEIVKRLVNSGNWADVAVGIQLAYNLPFEEFKRIFDRFQTEILNSENFRFSRNGEVWVVSIFIHNATDWGGGRLGYYDYWRDITPEQYK